jgi:hypothetical protein
MQFNMGDVLVDGKSTGSAMFLSSLLFYIMSHVNEKYN